jgi:hypothetical protein
MSTHDEPEAILSALSRPLIAYRSALDDGVSFADTQMADLPTCPYTWAALVRYWACHRFVELTDAQADWHVRRLRNNGMEIQIDGYVLRPLKAIEAGPPSPGANLARRQYFTQFYQLSLIDAGIFVPQGANLLIDWDVGKNRQPILALSKPVGFWKYKGKPRLECKGIVFGSDDDFPTFIPPAEDDFDVNPRFDQDEFGMESDAG